MAIMIPHTPFDTSSEGENSIFYSLQKNLSDDFIVFHSVSWVNSSRKAQGEADFLILSRYYGILIVEVKAGYLRCDNRRWFQTNRNTGIEKEIQDPLAQADRSKFKFIEILDEQNPSINDCLVSHAVWFPSFEWTYPTPVNYSDDIIFDSQTLENPESDILNAYKYWHSQFKKRELSKESFDRLKFIIAPEFSSVPSVRSNFELREKLFITLTREQAILMDFLSEQKSAIISGAAGTGKTMLALEKANRLGVKNEHTLFLCFSSALKHHLEYNNPINFVEFRTIHDLADERSIESHGLTLNELTDVLTINLLDKYNRKWHYKNVIIDEAQDFNSIFIEQLANLVSEVDGTFYAFYDKNQNILQLENADWINDADCKLTLHTNCRNTKEIARTSARNIGLDSSSFVNSPVIGETSFFKEYHSNSDGFILVEKIVNHLISDKKANPEDIVILSMNNIDDSFLLNHKSIYGVSISQVLTKGKICFNTIEEFKGLEGGYVILIDVIVSDYAKLFYRNRLYIGCSRAKQGLYMLFQSPSDEDYSIAMDSIESKTKIKKTKQSFYKKLAVQELNI